ncbi:hypothetical protein G3M81_22900 [Bacillus paralicheniformis]|uniref:hypothetical protein n=1 Tax=Bacillus TaxID=1386 RepID=UPI0013EE577D|nr:MULTISPECIES: hypothetical protein [Bacillus]QII26941.1 hypothetical protein G3M80_20810 [Bacillus altitudinis]QII51409.1 hypothetical protein G3M81_22900 [Bacillus paralicheniformis]
MTNEFMEMVKKLGDRDIEEAQDRDFDSWSYSLQHFIQQLYDLLGSIDNVNDDSNLDGLTKEEIEKRKAILDVAFSYIQISAEEISQFLKSEYKNELNKPRFDDLNI